MDEIYMNKESSVQISQKFTFFRGKQNKYVTTNLGMCFRTKKMEEKMHEKEK